MIGATAPRYVYRGPGYSAEELAAARAASREAPEPDPAEDEAEDGAEYTEPEPARTVRARRTVPAAPLALPPAVAPTPTAEGWYDHFYRTGDADWKPPVRTGRDDA